jgi:hypothetical protein
MKWQWCRLLALILPLLTALGFAIYAAVAGWNRAGEAPISGTGNVAMVIGGVVSMGLAGGLVWLLIYSQRHGYDQ